MERMKEVAEQVGYPFPYLFDESQEVAKAYDATCTPDFFIYDKNLCLVYRGKWMIHALVMESRLPGMIYVLHLMNL